MFESKKQKYVKQLDQVIIADNVKLIIQILMDLRETDFACPFDYVELLCKNYMYTLRCHASRYKDPNSCQKVCATKNESSSHEHFFRYDKNDVYWRRRTDRIY